MPNSAINYINVDLVDSLSLVQSYFSISTGRWCNSTSWLQLLTNDFGLKYHKTTALANLRSSEMFRKNNNKSVYTPQWHSSGIVVVPRRFSFLFIKSTL